MGVCVTQPEEECKPVPFRNCTGVIETKQDRRCFDVTELICGLKEEVQFDTIVEEFQVQLCTVMKERLCDTSYVIGQTTRDDFQAPTWRPPSARTRSLPSWTSPARTPSTSTARRKRLRSWGWRATACSPPARRSPGGAATRPPDRLGLRSASPTTAGSARR